MFAQPYIYIPIEILLYKIVSLTPSPINTDVILDLSLMCNQKKIISEIAVSKYFKRLIQDVKARMPYMSQREFKKEATAPVMKENDKWYNNLVSEYMEDIANYNMKHIERRTIWNLTNHLPTECARVP